MQVGLYMCGCQWQWFR